MKFIMFENIGRHLTLSEYEYDCTHVQFKQFVLL